MAALDLRSSRIQCALLGLGVPGIVRSFQGGRRGWVLVLCAGAVAPLEPVTSAG